MLFIHLTMGLELNRIPSIYYATQPHCRKANHQQPQRFTLYCSPKNMQIRTSIVQIGNSTPHPHNKRAKKRNERLYTVVL